MYRYTYLSVKLMHTVRYYLSIYLSIYLVWIIIYTLSCREGIHLLVRYRAVSVHSRPRVPKNNEFRGDGKELGKAWSV
jgi:hypothetical protein